MDDSWIRGNLEPLVGKTSLVGTTTWDHLAVYRPEAFTQSLSELGLSTE
ncbi:hypothetical protein QFZ67_003816 [Streptomyces sp. V1I1]|nr:hypothetical protein [Streptomyces sp. V1I1]